MSSGVQGCTPTVRTPRRRSIAISASVRTPVGGGAQPLLDREQLMDKLGGRHRRPHALEEVGPDPIGRPGAAEGRRDRRSGAEGRARTAPGAALRPRRASPRRSGDDPPCTGGSRPTSRSRTAFAASTSSANGYTLRAERVGLGRRPNALPERVLEHLGHARVALQRRDAPGASDPRACASPDSASRPIGT